MGRPKGALRRLQDSHYTNTFFEQTAPCPCSPFCTHRIGAAVAHANPTTGASSSHAMTAPISAKAITAALSPRSPDPRALDEMLAKLSPQEYEKFWEYMTEAGAESGVFTHKAFHMQRQALSACLGFIDQEKFRAEGVFPAVEGYGLEGLERVVEIYEGRYQEFRGKREKAMEEIARQLQAIRFDEFRRTTTSNSRHAVPGWKEIVKVSPQFNILCYKALSDDMIFSILLPTQLFIAEKRFGFIEEAFELWNFDDDSHPIIRRQKGPNTTFRMMMNCPEKLVPPPDMTKASLKKLAKAKTGTRPTSRLGAMGALAEFKRHCIELAKQVKAAHEAIHNEPWKVPRLPKKIKYHSVVIDRTLPRRIRQSLYDLEFITREISRMKVLIRKQRVDAGSVIMTWVSTSPVSWEYGKKHVHEMPVMREYEYNRKSVAASYVIARQQHLKLAKFFGSKKGVPLLTDSLASVLKMEGGRSLAEIEAEWEAMIAEDLKVNSSVDDTLAYVEQMKSEEKKEDKGDWWTYLIQPPQAPAMPLSQR